MSLKGIVYKTKDCLKEIFFEKITKQKILYKFKTSMFYTLKKDET